MVGKGTMRDEVMDLLGVPDNDMIGETGVAHDMEKAKRVLAEFVARENIDVFLQTPIVDGILEDMSLMLDGDDKRRYAHHRRKGDSGCYGGRGCGSFCRGTGGEGARGWADAAGDFGIHPGRCG